MLVLNIAVSPHFTKLATSLGFSLIYIEYPFRKICSESLSFLDCSRSFQLSERRLELDASIKHQAFHAPIQMQIDLNKAFYSLTLDSAHEKFDV